MNKFIAYLKVYIHCLRNLFKPEGHMQCASDIVTKNGKLENRTVEIFCSCGFNHTEGLTWAQVKKLGVPNDT